MNKEIILNFVNNFFEFETLVCKVATEIQNIRRIYGNYNRFTIVKNGDSFNVVVTIEDYVAGETCYDDISFPSDYLFTDYKEIEKEKYEKELALKQKAFQDNIDRQNKEKEKEEYNLYLELKEKYGKTQSI